MANTGPVSVTITAVDINGNSVPKTYNNVKQINYDFTDRTINVVDETGSFYFGYSSTATVTHVIVGGASVITIT